ncbi:antitoxin [Janibacter sp. GS2]|uniref:antitoxin n=1 Tax=Janibacter sp. GS2 TaxID=3442646 RepID=UPI003EB938BC
MARFKNAAAVFTAAETARQWARKNPDKAQGYLDKATGFVDQRTKGKYRSQIDSLSRKAKKNLTGHETIPGSTVRDTDAPEAPRDSARTRPFPDMRA